MRYIAAIIILTAIIASGCSSLHIIMIRDYDAYLKVPLGSTVKMEGITQRFEDSDDTAMLILKNGQKMPLGGKKVFLLIHGKHVMVTGTMKAKTMPLLDKNGKSTGKMSLTLKYIDVSDYVTARE